MATSPMSRYPLSEDRGDAPLAIGPRIHAVKSS